MPRTERFAPRKDPVPIVQDAGWTPTPVWMGMEYLIPTGTRSPDVHPVVSRYTDWAIPAHKQEDIKQRKTTNKKQKKGLYLNCYMKIMTCTICEVSQIWNINAFWLLNVMYLMPEDDKYEQNL